MAHKAVLLFDLLLAQGHIDKQVEDKSVITNLSLDFDCGDLRGKKIAILDDIVISGTSIASTIDKLKYYQVSQNDIEIIAIAVDKYYFAMSFDDANGVSVLHCDYYTDDASCIELSAIISKAFSYYGIPYDVDFPVYEGISIVSEDLNTLHNNLFWEMIDITNDNQRSGDVTAFTVQTKWAIRHRLWDAIGVELEKCAEVKIRLYITRYPDGSLECSIVPMCLFKEIHEDKLNLLYSRLKPESWKTSFYENKSNVAQMRYVEFYIAHQLFLIFSQITALGYGCSFQERLAMWLFGSKDGEVVCNHLQARNSRINCSSCIHIDSVQVDHSDVFMEYKKSIVHEDSCKHGIKWGNANAYEVGCWVNQNILDPFLWWYDEKEIPVRNQLKRAALHYVDNYQEIQKHLFRLKSGLSFSVLQHILKERLPELSDCEANNVISLFIDRAIDEGIIVPTVYHSQEGKYICRSYRHGEDLPFGMADKYRLVYFLNSLSEKICGRSNEDETTVYLEVAEISLEKMIVLFYQMGLKLGNTFNRFLGFNNIEVIHSFLSIHGAIQGYTDPSTEVHIYSEKDSEGNRYITWLSTWLLKETLIERTMGSQEGTPHFSINLRRIREYLEDNQRSSVSEAVRVNIDSIAELIARWYNSMSKERKGEFKTQITALTSCASMTVYASAIATEIHYFFNYWNHQVQEAFEEQYRSYKLVARLTGGDDNKKHTANIVQGLHSGRDKINWRKDNKAQAVIEEVKTILDANSIMNWTRIWDGVDEYNGNRELSEYISVAEGLLFFFSACFDCINSEDFWTKGILPKQYDEYKSNYMDSLEHTGYWDLGAFEQLGKIAKMTDDGLNSKKKALQDLVMPVLKISEDCVKEIETFIHDHDSIYTIEYDSALIIDIEAFDAEAIDEAMMCLWEIASKVDECDRSELNFIKFPDSLDHETFRKYGIFLGHHKKRKVDSSFKRSNDTPECRGRILYELFEKLCSLLDGKLKRVRAILLPHTNAGPKSFFKHNLERNIGRNAMEYYIDIVQPMEFFYKDDELKQLVLGLNRNVRREFLECFGEWTKEEINCVSMALGYTTCIVYSMPYVHLDGNTDLVAKLHYSQIKVKCGNKCGLGVLIRCPTRVLCVSCNHIFTEYSEKHYVEAESAYDANFKFNLVPLSEIRKNENIHRYPHASEEVVFLEPHWNGDIPFKVSNLISEVDGRNLSNERECMLYGCNSDKQTMWFHKLQALGGVDQGYRQINGKDIENIGEGCSGGIYVQDDYIVGIHAGRFNRHNAALMIPWSIIGQALEKVSKRSINDEEYTRD